MLRFLIRLVLNLFTQDNTETEIIDYSFKKPYCEAPDNIVCIYRDCEQCKMYKVKDQQFTVYSRVNLYKGE